jgi:protein involved in polysaccharide export with SLBB domain
MSRWAWVPMLAWLSAGCADRAVAPYPISPPPVKADAAVGPGDLFDVRVFGEPGLSSNYEVADDGTINFPLIGVVEVAGKVPTEIEKEIQGRLADGYIKHPSVSVRVNEYRSKKVSVFGQVRSPGTFAFTDNMSVVEAISRAGGFTAMAKKNEVRITRGSKGKDTTSIIVAVDDIGRGKAPNFLLRPGDVIFVPERLF